MTYSILALDRDAGMIGGAATTGSLCVGGWVLRGDVRAGLSASQGAAPSTFWGEDVLARMRAGDGADTAVATVTGADSGREARQLSALDLSGGTGVFTGRDNTAWRGSLAADGVIVAGNLLTGEAVLAAVLDTYADSSGTIAERLLRALQAGERAGGDSRGLMSAALLVLGPDRPPLTLRVDYSETPLADLEALLGRATGGDYGAWTRTVPVLNDPQRRDV